MALKVFAGCAGAAMGAVVVGPAAALMSEPVFDRTLGAAGWVRLVRLEALETGRPTRANVVGAEVDAWTRAGDRRLGAVWLVRDAESSVRAFSAVCPHLGCAIELAADHFNCPCHESAFSLAGAATSGPSPRGMDPLEVHLTDGWVMVRYVRFRQGIAARIAL